jgi:hypothetical protein
MNRRAAMLATGANPEAGIEVDDQAGMFPTRSGFF